MPKELRKKYTKEFKEEAVKLVTEQGYMLTEAAKSLGINAKMLGRWKRQYEEKAGDAFPGNGVQTGTEEQLRKLAVENRRLRMERDILKKATAFFARELV